MRGRAGGLGVRAKCRTGVAHGFGALMGWTRGHVADQRKGPTHDCETRRVLVVVREFVDDVVVRLES